MTIASISEFFNRLKDENHPYKLQFVRMSKKYYLYVWRKIIPPQVQEAAKEMEKQQEIEDLIVGWKKMLADLDLPNGSAAGQEADGSGKKYKKCYGR
jgi:hypothetical protein